MIYSSVYPLYEVQYLLHSRCCNELLPICRSSAVSTSEISIYRLLAPIRFDHPHSASQPKVHVDALAHALWPLHAITAGLDVQADFACEVTAWHRRSRCKSRWPYVLGCSYCTAGFSAVKSPTSDAHARYVKVPRHSRPNPRLDSTGLPWSLRNVYHHCVVASAQFCGVCSISFLCINCALNVNFATNVRTAICWPQDTCALEKARASG